MRRPLQGAQHPIGDALVVATWSAVLGVLGGVGWWLLAPTVVTTQTEAGPSLQPAALAAQVGIDTWFGVLALAGGVLTGVVLMGLRPRRPVLMTVLLVAGGLVSSLLMLAVGGLLGPPDPRTVLASAAVGETATMSLGLRATGLVWLWSAAAAFGVVSWVLVIAKPESPEVEEMAEEAGLADDGLAEGGSDGGPHLGAFDPDSPGVR